MFGSKSKGQESRMATDNVLNTISKGTVLVGNITTKGDIRVEGKIIGTITCSSKLVIGNDGYVEGNVDAKNANIAGEVKGTVIIRELLQLHESGKIVGDIYTQKLAVKIGANFSGTCRMGEDAKDVLQKAPANIEEVIKREQRNLQLNGNADNNQYTHSSENSQSNEEAVEERQALG